MGCGVSEDDETKKAPASPIEEPPVVVAATSKDVASKERSTNNNNNNKSKAKASAVASSSSPPAAHHAAATATAVVEPQVKSELCGQVLTALKQVQAQTASTVSVQPFNADKATTAHQLCMFIKPELLQVGIVNIDEALAYVLNHLVKNHCTIGGVTVLGGTYIAEKNLIAQHYGVINKISTQGTAAMTGTALAKLKKANVEQLRVLGAHQAMALFPERLTAQQLMAANLEIGAIRLAGGTYYIPFTLPNNEQVFLLNPFHPMQLIPYTTAGNGIIILEVNSELDWATLRQDVCGATNPKQAHIGSIRHGLAAQKDVFKIPSVNSSANCIHMSAGPIEGVVELQRFFELKEATQTRFGAELTTAVTAERAQLLLQNINIVLDDGHSSVVSSFDATEEVNSNEALDILQASQ